MTGNRPSRTRRTFDQLVRLSRPEGRVRQAEIADGAWLVVLVLDDVVTLTIKRPRLRLSDSELATFRRDCRVPSDAEVVSGPDQRTRQLELLWFYVTFRWVLPAEKEKDDERTTTA